MQFEKNLALLRKKKGLSQDELAFAIGVTRQTIYTWEAGLNYPTILMLKKLADALEVSTDDLLNGFAVNKLPKTIQSIRLSFVSKHQGSVLYQELPNWFASLKTGAEVSWAIYDLAKEGFRKDFSYQIETIGEMKLHGLDAVEIAIQEYDPELTMSRKYEQYVSLTEEGVAWLGETIYEKGSKSIRTFKDKDFLKDWGYNKKPGYQPTHFEEAEDYVLEIDGKKRNAIKLTYLEEMGAICSEVYLNQESESLFWRRFTKKGNKEKRSNQEIRFAGEIYDLDYCCLTSRW